MRLRSKMFVALMVAAVVAATLPALAAADSSAAPPVVFKLGMTGEFTGTNPFALPTPPNLGVVSLMYDFLTYHNDDLQITPCLAESWTTSADGKVWTFKIRSGVTWSDGTPLTARDVVFTYNLILGNPQYTYNWLMYLDHVVKIEAPDDTTVVITCDSPKADTASNVIPILPEHLWKDIKPSKLPNLADVPNVGSGPFAFDRKDGNAVIMKANTSYWGGAPHIDQFNLMLYTTEDGLVQDFKAGNLDLAEFGNGASLRAVEGVKGSTLAVITTIMNSSLAINCWDDPKSGGNPALLDLGVRQAIHAAIDIPKVANLCTDGRGTAGGSMLSPAYAGWYAPVPADRQVTYDPEKAKQLLTDAGYTDRNGDGIREDAKGNKLSFRLAAMTDFPQQAQAVPMVGQYLKDVGIGVKIENLSSAALYERVYTNYDYDMMISLYPMDVDPNYLFSWLTSTQLFMASDTGFSNAEYDALYDKQAATIDQATRVGLVHDLALLAYDQAPYVVLWYPPAFVAYRTDRWTGFQDPPKDVVEPFYVFTRVHSLDIAPIVGAEAEAGGGGLSSAAIAGIVVIAVIVVGLVVWVAVRRRPRSEED